MSDVSELQAAALAFARFRKEQQLGEITPELLVLRDGRAAAVAWHSELSELLRVADTVAHAFGGEGLALVFEGVLPLVPDNPLTGSPWERGDADAVWRNHEGVSKGWITECQLVSLVTREMRAATTAHAFKLQDKTVVWTEEIQSLGGGVGVEKALAGALSQPAIDVSQVPDPGDRVVAPVGAPLLSPERGRLSIDIGMTRLLDARFGDEVQNGGALLILPDQETAERYGHEGLMAWQQLIYQPRE